MEELFHIATGLKKLDCSQVAQICNLLYCRFVICWPLNLLVQQRSAGHAEGNSAIQQRATLRYACGHASAHRSRWAANLLALRVELCCFICVASALVALATSPELQSVNPNGGQRGTEFEVSFAGERLQDTEEVVCYEPGIEVLKLNSVTNKLVKAQFKLAPDCGLGEHHLRLRTTTGLSQIRTFLVGPFPVIEEVEPNNEPAKAQKIPLNSTVSGVIKNEDVDCFGVELKKGQRFSAEVEGIRLGRGLFDSRLAILDPDGAVIADVDDTWLAMQDPFVTLLAPKDGTYVARLREATYGGNDQCQYRLHLGTFARPSAVFPAGGKAGDPLALTCYTAGITNFSWQTKLPGTPQEKYGVFPELDGMPTPTANWVRVSEFSNVLAVTPNQDREHATPATLQPPFALNGIIARPGQEDWFRFPAIKGTALAVNVYARRLRSPLDSVLDLFDCKGQHLSSNDDAAGADSSLRFTPSESTNYFVRIRDTLGQGGTDFVYRIEVVPVQPGLAIKIPEVARNDTQSRQFIAVPRGNRVATLISAKRSDFSSDLLFSVTNLPTGVRMDAFPMPPNVDAMPLVFEAETNAAIGCKLLDLVATGTNGTNEVTGKFKQEIELVEGPNNINFYGTSVEKFCVAVVKEAPFHLRLARPKVPLVQGGSLPLEVLVERGAGFDEPIEVQMVWNPPGVSSQPEVTIPKSGTNVAYPLNADGGAQTRLWKIAVLGHATVDGGQLYVSSELTELEVAPPFLSGKIETAWINPGKSGKLTVNLQQAKAFEGKAKIKLCGLPEKVTAADKEITKDDQEVVFDLTVGPGCSPGAYRNLFCAVDVPQDGRVIAHSIARGGILRIVPPKKTETSVASAEKK